MHTMSACTQCRYNFFFVTSVAGGLSTITHRSTNSRVRAGLSLCENDVAAADLTYPLTAPDYQAWYSSVLGCTCSKVPTCMQRLGVRVDACRRLGV